MKLVYERVKNVRDFRLNSTFKNIADRPHLFRDLKNPKSFIVIPSVSSERRKYVPIGFLDDNFIPTTQVSIIPDATLYHFGVLTSSIHMAWLRTVGGRLESRYRYSKDVVYNNFVWIKPTKAQRLAVEQSAQKILDARKNYPESTLADLYDEISMPADLRQAHRENDLAVAKAYGWEKFLDDEPTLAVKLLKLYEKIVEKSLSG